MTKQYNGCLGKDMEQSIFDPKELKKIFSTLKGGGCKCCSIVVGLETLHLISRFPKHFGANKCLFVYCNVVRVLFSSYPSHMLRWLGRVAHRMLIAYQIIASFNGTDDQIKLCNLPTNIERECYNLHHFVSWFPTVGPNPSHP